MGARIFKARLTLKAGQIFRATVCAMAALAATVTMTAAAQAHAAAPKTVAACKHRFGTGSATDRQRRAACIKRVKDEKPGSSCRHPLESRVATDGESVGDLKDYTVTLLQLSENPQSLPGPRIVRVNVVIHNPRVVLCSIEADEIRNDLATGTRVKHVFHPTISPHGGLSTPLAEQEGDVLFGVRVFARYNAPPATEGNHSQ